MIRLDWKIGPLLRDKDVYGQAVKALNTSKYFGATEEVEDILMSSSTPGWLDKKSSQSLPK